MKYPVRNIKDVSLIGNSFNFSVYFKKYVSNNPVINPIITLIIVKLINLYIIPNILCSYIPINTPSLFINLNIIIITASFTIPSPNIILFSLGKLFSFTKPTAATVSLLDIKQDINNISYKLNLSFIIHSYSFIKYIKQHNTKNVIIEDIIPKYDIIPKFSKKCFLPKL